VQDNEVSNNIVVNKWKWINVLLYKSIVASDYVTNKLIIFLATYQVM